MNGTLKMKIGKKKSQKFKNKNVKLPYSVQKAWLKFTVVALQPLRF